MPDSLTTQLCETLSIELPIVQAPIGSATSPELISAVAEAGGLGVAAMTWRADDEVDAFISRVGALTRKSFAVNFVLEFDIDQQLGRCLDRGIRFVSTAWGDPGRVVERIHAAGAIHLHTVGSVDEARHAADSGVDVIVAQGWEAGGHVLGGVAALPLIPAVVDAVAPVPVIAAGGIADGRGLAAVLALGAQAGWIGTRFLAASEAYTHELYRQRVIAAGSEDAVYTMCFDGGWAGAPHRVLRNSTLSSWEAAGRPSSPNRPNEGEVVATDASAREHRRYDDIMPLPGMVGDLEALALYAGQSAALVRDVMPAGVIVRQIAAEARRALERLSPASATNIEQQI